MTYLFLYSALLLFLLNYSPSFQKDILVTNPLDPSGPAVSFDFVCLNSTSCSSNGLCQNSTHCQCSEGMSTLYDKSSNPHSFQCNYNQKSRKIAFLLSFFLGPLSFDQFYLGNNFLGLVKLLLPSSLILIGISLFVIGKAKKNYDCQFTGRVFEFIATVFIILWWLIDWILIISNSYSDLNSIPMY
jgi:TM2 domain-containing membrane protein YozV